MTACAPNNNRQLNSSQVQIPYICWFVSQKGPISLNIHVQMLKQHWVVSHFDSTARLQDGTLQVSPEVI